MNAIERIRQAIACYTQTNRTPALSLEMNLGCRPAIVRVKERLSEGDERVMLCGRFEDHCGKQLPITFERGSGTLTISTEAGLIAVLRELFGDCVPDVNWPSIGDLAFLSIPGSFDEKVVVRHVDSQGNAEVIVATGLRRGYVYAANISQLRPRTGDEPLTLHDQAMDEVYGVAIEDSKVVGTAIDGQPIHEVEVALNGPRPALTQVQNVGERPICAHEIANIIGITGDNRLMIERGGADETETYATDRRFATSVALCPHCLRSHDPNKPIECQCGYKTAVLTHRLEDCQLAGLVKLRDRLNEVIYDKERAAK